MIPDFFIGFLGLAEINKKKPPKKVKRKFPRLATTDGVEPSTRWLQISF